MTAAIISKRRKIQIQNAAEAAGQGLQDEKKRAGTLPCLAFSLYRLVNLLGFGNTFRLRESSPPTVKTRTPFHLFKAKGLRSTC
jgi:hypothetical protein